VLSNSLRSESWCYFFGKAPERVVIEWRIRNADEVRDPDFNISMNAVAQFGWRSDEQTGFYGFWWGAERARHCGYGFAFLRRRFSDQHCSRPRHFDIFELPTYRSAVLFQNAYLVAE